MTSNIARLSLVLGLTALFASACATTDTRIQKNQTAFNAYPPSVQQAIRNGRIEIGFTPDQVRMAMGEPTRSYTRTSASGTSLVWAYAEKKSSLSFGVGVGGGSGGVGGGVGVSTGSDRADDKLRVIFENERVMTVEQTKS
jgi:outer membrane protein assembly factor BamE (lipoprotein component of BamABCDE complex)